MGIRISAPPQRPATARITLLASTSVTATWIPRRYGRSGATRTARGRSCRMRCSVLLAIMALATVATATPTPLPEAMRFQGQISGHALSLLRLRRGRAIRQTLQPHQLPAIAPAPEMHHDWLRPGRMRRAHGAELDSDEGSWRACQARRRLQRRLAALAITDVCRRPRRVVECGPDGLVPTRAPRDRAGPRHCQTSERQRRSVSDRRWD